MTGKNVHNHIYKEIFNILILGILIVIQYLLLELSGGQAQLILKISNIRNIVLGVRTVLTVSVFILVISQSYLITTLLSSLIVAVLSLINYYVIEYHGQPFIVEDIVNIKSAITVMNNYSFSIKGVVLF